MAFDPQLAKLSAFFHKVIHAERQLSTSREGKLFIRCLCAQTDPAICAHRLISSSSGLSALQASVRFDTSVTFLNEDAPPLLRYLQTPSLGSINSGAVLRQLLLHMVDPPFFWDAFIKAFTAGLLNSDAIQCFAWLLLQLVTLPDKGSSPYLQVAGSSNILESILASPDGEIRILGQKIKHAFPTSASDIQDDSGAKPGGRHDNDHPDYRQISIMPTADEILSRDRPFFRTADWIDSPENASTRSGIHLDNQFRLLREDMLGGIREELKILTGKQTGRHRGIIVDGLSVSGVLIETDRRRRPWAVVLKGRGELPLPKNVKPKKRVDFLKNNPHILRHGNMTCLLIDGEPAAYPTLYRVEGEIAANPVTITVQFVDDATMAYALCKMKTAESVRLAQLDTAIFAFEPFLRRLQDIHDLPLKEEILNWEINGVVNGPSFQPKHIINSIRGQPGKDIKNILNTKKSINLDESQKRSLCMCLEQRVSLVQGPPGTGKSFIGALGAKILHDHTTQKILVVCFTNHALDQFLEDLLKIGITPDNIVRLGGKSTDKTRPLMIREQDRGKLTPTQWLQVDKLKQSLQAYDTRLRDAFKRFQTTNVQKNHLMEFLEFESGDPPFFEAFTVPMAGNDGMTRVGRKGRAMSPYYLLDRWIRGGNDAGPLQHMQPPGAAPIWAMSAELRQETLIRWRASILNDLVHEVQEAGRQYNAKRSELDGIFGELDTDIIKSKRIIACTTNGAAKYSSAIQAASPGVVLVEEAGEILEAHILTSLGSHTEQLILIGDHKQLRPKCSYDLSVEQGDGFDLNRSLFERLILKGFPHVALSQQHRMRPEISSMIRHLTYPDLTDAPSTLNRDDIRGFCDNVMFIDHSHPEVELNDHIQLNDGRTSSKQNDFEAQMILKCVRYLAQQGYGSDKMVVITPYLGQLRLLRDQLAQENDPILNDLDKFDLIRAGLLTDLSSKTSKPSLRISTIDNYQGEESDIVLVSMTRSNKSHDIGFMAAPERLNVLLSRARNGLIMIGNAETFIYARKGREVWCKLFDHLKENNHIYDGFPVKCEKHPDRKAILSKVEDFETHCPDGGCREPCSCHQLFDHSKIRCMAILKQKCSNGHNQSWKCFSGAPLVCSNCENERKEAEKRAQNALEQKLKRDERTRKHLKEIAKIDEEIEQLTQDMADARLESEQKAIIDQKRADLEVARKRVAGKQDTTCETPPTYPEHLGLKSVEGLAPVESPQSSPAPTKFTRDQRSKLRGCIKEAVEHNKSPSKTEWQRQKDQEKAYNPAIDKIMEMIGLEKVKEQVLRIKDKVEISTRQNTDLSKERLGLVLLGNPGTGMTLLPNPSTKNQPYSPYSVGKTTVARHYARVLTTLKVLSGEEFVETTGSRLAHGGIAEVKAHLGKLEKADGGVYFIDEAYQLAEGHNYGGKTVLDYLLAEIENLTGKVVFVFAGYQKEMEKFFEHNPGFSSRIPYTLVFEDYSDSELLGMLQAQMDRYYKSGVDIEGGVDGLYMQIAVKRLGRGRDRNGFGNARALENMFAQIRERQSDRLAKQRRGGLKPDDYHISKEDLIGPDPSKAILESSAWAKLQKLIGLQAVKESVISMIGLIKSNYERELGGKKLVEMPLNRVFLGPPGTGKTTVAKLFGQILKDIGMLSNGEVVVKNPADFIGSAMGQSEANTKAILASTVGKVLVIDEAYMLYSGTESGGGNGADIYKTAVIDTIVAEVQGVPGDDRCVLLLGYEEQMTVMFQNVNPGLTRRFQLSDAFRFDDFNDSELQEILELKLKDQDLGATPQAVSTAIDVLSRQRTGLNFGNGGAVENLISKAKASYQTRQSNLPIDQRSVEFTFEPQDFDEDFDRASGAGTNLQELFKDVVGCEEIVEKLDGYLKVANGMRAQGVDPRGQIPMNFIFKGPPGTGKTTTARKFGRVYYDLGFLSQIDVVECSATDLIGQYVGQTGPKTIKQLERGLGKVLFIDEAYRLGEGMFAQEAVNELVDNITKPRFAGKLVIILAGYDRDMNNLLSVNEGLSSRFADEIVFPPLGPQDCLKLLGEELKKKQIVFPLIHNDKMHRQLLDAISELSKLPSWGNARDVQTLAKSMTRLVFMNNTTKVEQLSLPATTALRCVQDMLSTRRKRASTSPPPLEPAPAVSQSLDMARQPPRTTLSTTATTMTAIELAHDTIPEAVESVDNPDQRDDGVPQAIWEQLQKDKKLAELEHQEMERKLERHEAAAKFAEEVREKAEKFASELRDRKAKDEAERMEILRLREEARIRELKAKDERDRIRQELERQREIAEEKRKQEAKAQKKLREMGVCVAGYRWIKQSGGYGCAGGTHWVSDSQLGN
ncbi:hypothetical protein FQN54_000739 [Arachnomyces sp. PD_36]|nr:hypothetical protein FQN54_000739 [Arachnomyces sp. PD_36]